MSMAPSPRPFWPPLVAGIALGAVLFLAFAITGHGLGASGFFTRLAALAGSALAPEAARANAYLGELAKLANPLAAWITWEIAGVVLGGLTGSLIGRRFRPTVEAGAGVPASRRLAWAFAGGILVGFGSRLARGCTSGLGLSGGATLAVAAFVFLATFFAAGFAAMTLMRREWR